jgi:hypothetical protein
MHKNATKCNKTQINWCINKHGALKIIDTFETYQNQAPPTSVVDVLPAIRISPLCATRFCRGCMSPPPAGNRRPGERDPTATIPIKLCLEEPSGGGEEGGRCWERSVVDGWVFLGAGRRGSGMRWTEEFVSTEIPSHC